MSFSVFVALAHACYHLGADVRLHPTMLQAGDVKNEQIFASLKKKNAVEGLLKVVSVLTGKHACSLLRLTKLCQACLAV